MIAKMLDDMTRADIDGLITMKAEESRRLEYKRELQVATEQQKAEFLADVSSFANANGGDLIVGIEADKGIPVKADGIRVTSTDDFELQLSNIIREGLAAR